MQPMSLLVSCRNLLSHLTISNVKSGEKSNKCNQNEFIGFLQRPPLPPCGNPTSLPPSRSTSAVCLWHQNLETFWQLRIVCNWKFLQKSWDFVLKMFSWSGYQCIFMFMLFIIKIIMIKGNTFVARKRYPCGWKWTSGKLSGSRSPQARLAG